MTMQRNDNDRDSEEAFEQPGAEGRRLWQRVCADHPAAPMAPESEEIVANRLAAYLDGRLGGAELEAFEAELAASPQALDAFMAADVAVGASEAPPERLVRRAAALVPGEAIVPERPARRGIWSRLFGGGGSAVGGLALEGVGQSGGLRLRPIALTLTLAAILAVSVAGFEIGRLGYAVAAESYFPESDGITVASLAGF